MIKKIKALFKLVDIVGERDKSKNTFLHSYWSFGFNYEKTIFEEIESLQEKNDLLSKKIYQIEEYLGVHEETTESVTQLVKSKKK